MRLAAFATPSAVIALVNMRDFRPSISWIGAEAVPDSLRIVTPAHKQNDIIFVMIISQHLQGVSVS